MGCTSEAIPGVNWSGPCCCGSVTGLKGGIHPDTIQTATIDLRVEDHSVATFSNAIIINEPIHIIGVTLTHVAHFLDLTGGNEHKQIATRSPADTSTLYSHIPVSVSLYTLPAFTTGDLDIGGWNPATAYQDGRTYLMSGAVTPYQPYWTMPPDLFGIFADGALFAEINAPLKTFGVRLTVQYIPRAQFPPAYGDPVQVMQHAWKCAHGEDIEFLEGFYGGTSFDVDSSAVFSGASSAVRSSIITNPATQLTTIHTTFSW